MTCAGITITDADSLEAAADTLDEVEEITCPECEGRRTIADISPDTGARLKLICPCCAGARTVPAFDADGEDRGPEPPGWAASPRYTTRSSRCASPARGA
jgi:hypothetical protein